MRGGWPPGICGSCAAVVAGSRAAWLLVQCFALALWGSQTTKRELARPAVRSELDSPNVQCAARTAVG